MQVTMVEVNEIGRWLLTINRLQPEAAVGNMMLEGSRKATKTRITKVTFRPFMRLEHCSTQNIQVSN